MSATITTEPTLGAAEIDRLADIIQGAVRDRTAIGRLTEHTAMTLEDGYAVQAEVAARRIAAGEHLVGAKLGLTSRAKQVQMSVAEPLFGFLFSNGLQPANEPVVVSELIHPRIEPEIVFVMGDQLAGPGVSAADVIAATEWVCCGLEVIDSRFADFSFTAADVVADNTSEARVVLGPKLVRPDELDLGLVGLLLEAEGEQVATATGAASMGHPAEAVAMLANWLGSRGMALEPGWLVYSGGLTAAVPLKPGGHITATYGHLGSVTVRGA